MRAKYILKDALMVSGISLALLFAAEVTLRVMFPEELIPANAYDHSIYQFDPDFLVSLKPNTHSTFRRSKDNGGNLIQWNTNSHGQRGHELRLNPDIRVAVYGDSNVMAGFSRLEDSFPHRLEQELQALTKKDVEVINGGGVGMGPDQSLLKLTKEIDVLKPDIVVFHVFADNDFGDLIRNRLFDLDPSGNLVLTKHPRTVDELLTAAHDRSFPSSLLIVQRAWELWNSVRNRGTDAVETAEQLLQYCLTENAGQYAVYQSSGPRKYSHFADLYDADLAVFPESGAARAKIALMDAVLREAAAIARSRNAQFFVVIQPSPVDLTRNAILSYAELRRYPDYRPDNLSRAVEDILDLRQIDGINLFDAFSSQSPDDLYFKGEDDHWNDAGQFLAAKLTAQRLDSLISAAQDVKAVKGPVKGDATLYGVDA
jgi:hypothetical protein